MDETHSIQDCQDNPLLIKVVLDKLFDFCEFEQLDVCRQVCTLWESVSEPHWTRKVPMIEFFKKDDLDNPMDVFEVTYCDADLWSKNRFNKFGLDGFSFDDNWKIYYKLWNTHGEIITILEFTNCTFKSEHAFREIFLCSFTPNLQSLNLTDIMFIFQSTHNTVSTKETIVKSVSSMLYLEIEYHEEFKNIPIEWGHVIQTFSMLQTLVLKNYATNDETPCELTNVFQGLQAFHTKHNRGHPLRSLDVSRRSNFNQWMGFPEGILQHIRKEMDTRTDCCLDLQALLFAAANPLDVSKCSELIAWQSKGLKKLNFKCNVWKHELFLIPVSKFNLPPMCQLSHLNLIDVRLTNFKFLLACPNVTHINLILFEGNVQEMSLYNSIKCNRPGWGINEKKHLRLPSVVSFHCNFLMKWEESDMQQLSLWVPHTNSLLLHATNQSFLGICKSFKHLRSLFIYNSEVDDYAFTGINNAKHLPPMSFLQASPNITDLKELQVLGIQRLLQGKLGSPAQLVPAKLTTMFVTAGLLKMPHITKFYMSHSLMTFAALSALQEGGFSGTVIAKEYQHPSEFFFDAVPSL